MNPRSRIRHRRTWPPRAARWLAANLGGGRRLPWLPLWFAWRRARMIHAKAEAPRAATNPQAGASSFTLSLSCRFDWSRPARSAQAVSAGGGAGPVRYVQPGARPAFATGHRRAPMPMVTRFLAHFRVPNRAVGTASTADRQFTAPVPRVRQSVASSAVQSVAARSDLPSRGHHRIPRRRELLHDRSPASRRQSDNAKVAAAGIAASTSPYQPIQLHPSGPPAARANVLAGQVPLVFSRSDVRPAPNRREVPPNSPSPRLRVALDWRQPATETAVRSSAARSRPGASAIDASAASAPRQAPAAATLAAARALEPAVAERLVQDVIRRVDRRLRIERERRGL